MNHPLPIRPSFLPAPPEPEIPASLLASSSTAPPAAHTTDPTRCVICQTASPKYTCPGCSLRTCSLACSKGHKEKYTCSGRRDTTAFVPLKDVTEGVWSDDYRYLEEGRRKIAEWGTALPRGSVPVDTTRGGRGGRGGQRGSRGRTRPGRGAGDVRALGLGRQLEERGVLVEFMPEGMERRKRNQSSWNQKSAESSHHERTIANARTETLYLTVQVSVPREMVEPDKTGHKVFTHSRVAVPPAKSGGGSTLAALLPPEMADISIDTLVFAMPYHSLDREELAQKGEKYFPPLDPIVPLIDALRGSAFVEHPTIHVLKKDEWVDRLRKGAVVEMPLANRDLPITSRAGEKRKVDWVDESAPALPAAKPAIPVPTLPAKPSFAVPAAPVRAAPGGLGMGLVDYGSDEDEE